MNDRMKAIRFFGVVLASFAAPVLAAQNLPTQPQHASGLPSHIPPGHTIPPPAPKQPANPEPVYFYLYSKVTDHVNMDITEARLRRLLPLIEQYRKQDQQAHVDATIYFTGAVSQALEDRNKQTHILDFVLKYKKMGVIQIGYDGTDEPTYDHRPMLNATIEQKQYQDRWLERATGDEKFLTEGRDPLTGEIKPGAIGGLEKMQQIFGPADCIAGASVGVKVPHPLRNDEHIERTIPYTTIAEVGDWELVPVLRHYNTEAILYGLPATNRDYLAGYGGSVTMLGKIMSPEPDTAPELYWADNILRFSEAGGGGSRLIRLSGGVDPIKDATSRLDRSNIHIYHVELDNENDYLTADFIKGKMFNPALYYAYANPGNPQLPTDAHASAADLAAIQAKEDAALKWVLVEYLPAFAGNRVVSNTDLKKLTPPSFGFTLKTDELSKALNDTMNAVGITTYLPDYFKVGSHYLTLAETFQVLTDAFAEMSRTGKLPETVHVDRIYGPIGMGIAHGPNTGKVTVATIEKICAGLDPSLHDESGYPMPKNAIPPNVDINDKLRVTAAQYLRLMIHAIANPSPDAAIGVQMTYMQTGIGNFVPKARSLEDTGPIWTYKPAPLNQAEETKSNSSKFPAAERSVAEAF